MKITFVGYGILGKSIADALSHKNEIAVVEIDRIDDLKEHHDSDGIIICANDTDVASVLSKIPNFLPILIRSSISPETVDQIHNEYPDHSIVISPDFSRVTSSNNEFYNQKYIILGGEDPDCFWQDLFQDSLPNCKMIFNCSDKEAALIKYAADGFLNLKLSYFNELYDICQITGMDFNIVRQLIGHDPKIGPEYTMVPNLDGKQGWNQSDNQIIEQFVDWARIIESPLTTLETAIKYNNRVRKNT